MPEKVDLVGQFKRYLAATDILTDEDLRALSWEALQERWEQLATELMDPKCSNREAKEAAKEALTKRILFLEGGSYQDKTEDDIRLIANARQRFEAE